MVAVSRRKSQLEALQHAVVEAGVPIAEFLPVVCDITKVRRHGLCDSSCSKEGTHYGCSSGGTHLWPLPAGCQNGGAGMLAAARTHASAVAELACNLARVAQEAEVVALPRIIVKRWPGSGVEGVVNSAAVVRGGAGLLDGSTASWVEMVSTNLLGAAMVTREAVQVRALAPLWAAGREVARVKRGREAAAWHCHAWPALCCGSLGASRGHAAPMPCHHPLFLVGNI